MSPESSLPPKREPDLGRPEYVTLEAGQLHLRQWGEGSALVLIHDAGGSSASWADLASAIVRDDADIAVIAPDLIGAGGTTIDPLAAADLHRQAKYVIAGLQALGVERCVLVGDGAGAAVARLAEQLDPESVAAVVTFGAPIAEAAGAAPEWPEVDANGSELLSVWDEVVNTMIFRPWWDHSGSHRMARALPDARTIHEVFLDVVEHDGAHRAVAAEASRLWAELGPAADPITVSPESLLEVIAGVRGELSRVNFDSSRPTDEAGRYSYVEVSGLRIHTRQFGQDRDGRPLLLLHANPGSGRGLEPLARELGRTRPAIVWDTPGHGRSQDLVWEDSNAPTLADTYAPILIGMLDALGIEKCDVYGTHTGAGLAAELAITAPERVTSVVLDGVPLFDDNKQLVDDALAHYFIDLHPDAFGSHVRRAWGANVNTGLWWPHYNHTLSGVRTSDGYPPTLVHDMSLDMLRSAPHYARYYRAAWTWPATTRLPHMPHRTLVGTTPTDPLAAMTPTALALLPSGEEGQFAPFGRADSVPTTAATIAAFLDGGS